MKRQKAFKHLIRLFLMFLSSSISIQVKAAEIHENYNGIRALSMGGAAIAVVNDETALLVNPAALGKLRDSFLTVIDPEIEIGSGFESSVGTDITTPLRPQGLLNALNNSKATPAHFKFSIFPSLVLPNFGMGFLAKYRVDGEVDAAGTNYRLEYQSDMAFVFGFNFRMFDGRVKLGFNARVTNRTEINSEIIDATRTDLTIGNLASEGIGIGSDLGLIFTGPWKTLPTLSILARDFGGTKYDFKGGLFNNTATSPATEDQKVDVAFAFFPIIGKRTRTTVSLEARDVLTLSSETDSMKRYHLGMEFNFRDSFFFRLGMNQRYWTSGIEISVKNVQFQIASYGEEIGTAAVNREDRRYVLKLAYRF